jgi:hypothetical protein
MLTIMQETRCTFRVQKTVLAAAAASCLALGFASPNAAAATESQEELELPYCPRPGAEALADAPQQRDQQATAPSQDEQQTPVLQEPDSDALRVATYDANLTRNAPGQLFEELSAPGVEDATQVARVIQTVRPDVLVLTGIDVDAGENIAKAFNTNYLAVGGDDHTGITYPYHYTAASNAGVDSGADMNRNGTIGDPGDALGYGNFPGEQSMIVYSQYPLDADSVRDFTSMPWNAMPDNSIPSDVTDLERDILPLASVSHWDIPVNVDNETIHVLATSTADASESSYGTARNHDQIRFWQDYIDPETDYIRDHRGNQGPLPSDAAFVLAGSLKADPTGNGPADPTAITSLLESDQIIDPEPARKVTARTLSRGILPDTADTLQHTAPTPADNDETYRADYVLLSSDLNVADSGVLAADSQDADNGLFGLDHETHDHRIVWADIALGD